jgi:putative phosphoribosyl transferase
MIFENREQAARLLAGRLHHLRGKNPLVLAIPRGGVPMGRIIADSLGGEVDIVLVRKLGFPENPETAMGAVDESGALHLNEDLQRYGVTEEYINEEKKKQLSTIASRRKIYESVHPKISPEGRIVIVVDDGSATGFTMVAALQSLKPRRPALIIAAMAVAPPEVIRKISRIADEVVCLHVTSDFMAVGQFFKHFGQVSDDEALRLLSYTAKNDI